MLMLLHALLVLSLLSAVFTSSNPTLAVKTDSFLTAQEVESLRAIREEALSSKDAHELILNRTFGIGGAGHETVFLHDHLDKKLPGLRKQLEDLAKKVDSSSGWQPVFLSERALTARCLEYIRYQGQEGQTSVGWHADGATLLTVAVMLSSIESYEGGTVEFRSASVHESFNLSAGDALSWKGWIHHRVSPVTKGVRDVFVVEFWHGEDCSKTRLPRGDDSIEGLSLALSVDPTAANLHRNLGEHLCEQLPCADSEVELKASNAFRKALELDPDDATTNHALGKFLLGSSGFFQRAEGVKYLRRAHELDPTVAGPVPDFLNQHDIFVSRLKSAGIGVVVLAVLMPLIYLCERYEAEVTKKKS